MFDRPDSGERAVLVHIDFTDGREGTDPAELRELVVAAGGTPVAAIGGTRDRPDSRHFVGRGKLDEIAERAREATADVVVFDHALTPAQERNLERTLQVRVLDRISLILDIFAQRASTFEGKLQVELAQLKHLSTRLVRGWTHLERQRGGIGMRGPGEKQLESDRRLIGVRIKSIEQRLASVSRRRALSRRARSRASVPVVSLVGYTNAGKSTLFNALTGAGVETADRLFATLDPTLRRLNVAGGREIILVDTVGFVSQLPHELVAAFRATLEETRLASLLLHVVDASDPERTEKKAQVNAVLRDIGAHDVPQIEVYNKIDKVHGETDSPRMGPVDEGGGHSPPRARVSAFTGAGVDGLATMLVRHFSADLVHRRIRLPIGEGRLRARLFELGTVLDERTGDDGSLLLDVAVPAASFERLCRREGLDVCVVGEITEPALN